MLQVSGRVGQASFPGRLTVCDIDNHNFNGGVAAGTSPHPHGRQAASTASDWSDVLNLDSVSFIDWE